MRHAATYIARRLAARTAVLVPLGAVTALAAVAALSGAWKWGG